MKIFFFMNSTNFIIISKSLKAIGAGLACSGSIGAGVGTGLVFAALLQSYSTNPKLKTQLFSYALLGFALSEAVGLLALMMARITLYT
jgi:F-type H+-transporting ATPase subunit c